MQPLIISTVLFSFLDGCTRALVKIDRCSWALIRFPPILFIHCITENSQSLLFYTHIINCVAGGLSSSRNSWAAWQENICCLVYSDLSDDFSAIFSSGLLLVLMLSGGGRCRGEQKTKKIFCGNNFNLYLTPKSKYMLVSDQYSHRTGQISADLCFCKVWAERVITVRYHKQNMQGGENCENKTQI